MINSLFFRFTIPPGTCKDAEACRARSHNIHKLIINDLKAEKVHVTNSVSHVLVTSRLLCGLVGQLARCDLLSTLFPLGKIPWP